MYSIYVLDHLILDSPYVYSIKHSKIKSDILSNSLAMNGQKVLSRVG